MPTPNDEYDAIVRAFRESLARGDRPDLRAVWASCPGGGKELLLELIETELIHEVKARRSPRIYDEYPSSFPELTAQELDAFHDLVHRHERILGRPLREQITDALSPASDFPWIPGYQVIRLIARGALGDVWLAKNLELGREEALKIQQAGDLAGPRLDEVQACAILERPNLCRIYRAFEWGDKLVIAFEYVDGLTLQQWKKSTARRPSQEVARLLAPIAEALAYVHEKGWSHGDVKPGNVLLRKSDNSPVLIDLGFARRLDARPDARRMIRGTPQFMAPEQAAGQPASVATDVYSLGATFYDLIRGCPPFDGKTPREVLARLEKESPELPGELGTDVRAILAFALARNPRDRYGSAGALAEDLRLHAAGNLPRHAPVGLLRTVAHRVRQHRLEVIFGAIVGAVLVVAVCLAFYLENTWDTDRKQDQVRRSLNEALSRDKLKGADKDQIERWLAELDTFDRASADRERERYLDRLVRLHDPAPEPLTRDDLERIERLLTSAPGGRQGVRRWSVSPQRWVKFLERAAPYTSRTSLYFFLRRDPERLANLERAARIQPWLAPDPDVVGVQMELICAAMHDGRYDRAWEVAEKVLSQPSVPPTWRMSILRYYVWIAIRRGTNDHLRAAENRVEQVIRSGEKVAAFMEVERARLQLAQGFRSEARQTLEIVQQKVRAGKLPVHFDVVADSGATGEVLYENVPALSVLEGALLLGLLEEQQGEASKARETWRWAYDKVRRQQMACCYQATLLGSLGETIEEEDAAKTVKFTLDDAKIQGLPPELMNNLRLVFDQPAEAKQDHPARVARKVVTLCLRRAWTSTHGREFACKFADRRLPFAEYATAHVRLWLFEGLRIAVIGLAARPEMLSDEEGKLLWNLVQEIERYYQGGDLTDRQLLELLALGFQGGSVEALRAIAKGELSSLLGPLAYVLSRQHRLNLTEGDREADRFLEEARRQADPRRDQPLELLQAVLNKK
jgi:hypothetical protein